MADEKKLTEPTQKTLDDFKGTKAEVMAQKTAVIREFGYDAWTKIINNTRGMKK